MLNLKNLLKSEPSKSLPLSSIVDNIDKLRIPCRPIDFIRKYPCFFEEYFPGNVGIHPHVKLTQESLHLDSEEQLVYDSVTFRKGAADRLLKLLMLCRVNEIPLKLIDRLKWDLGLPDNYVDTLVPEFPDYFKVKKLNEASIRSNRVESLLELVCWSNELAVSVMEKKARKENAEYEKGMPVAFPLEFSKGFEMDKKLKKWLDEWQKVPYVSPYENASHLQPNTDVSDKWVVAVLHELLHILVTKKTERDNMLCIGEYLGLKPRIKRALAHHPGIFYRSGKIGTHTMVLREGYKRGLLVDKNPLIDMRNKYIHLMHKVKEVQKLKRVPSSNDTKQQTMKEGVTEEEDDGKGPGEEMQFSDSDVDDESYDDEDEEEEQVESPRGGSNNGGKESTMVIEGRGKLREGRGRPGRNADESDDDDDTEEEEHTYSSRGGSNNGRRESGKANEGRKNHLEGRERPKRNASWDERGDGRSGSGMVKESRGKPGEGRERPRRNASWDERGGDRRRGSGKVSEGWKTPVEGRGRTRSNALWDERGDGNGRRGSGKVNEGRRTPGEGRERPMRNALWDERGDGDGRRGLGKVNEARRKPGEGRGRPGRNAPWDERSNGDKRVESSRDQYSDGSRGSRKVTEGRIHSGESRGRGRTNASRERFAKTYPRRT